MISSVVSDFADILASCSNPGVSVVIMVVLRIVVLEVPWD
jgi:hypothetical protein